MDKNEKASELGNMILVGCIFSILTWAAIAISPVAIAVTGIVGLGFIAWGAIGKGARRNEN